jgi:hypothetical protein
MIAISTDQRCIPVLKSKNQCRCYSDSTGFVRNKQHTSSRPVRRIDDGVDPRLQASRPPTRMVTVLGTTTVSVLASRRTRRWTLATIVLHRFVEVSGGELYRSERKKCFDNITNGMVGNICKVGIAEIQKIWGMRRFWNELQESIDFSKSIQLFYSFGWDSRFSTMNQVGEVKSNTLLAYLFPTHIIIR